MVRLGSLTSASPPSHPPPVLLLAPTIDHLLEDVPGDSKLLMSLPLRGSLTKVVGLRPLPPARTCSGGKSPPPTPRVSWSRWPSWRCAPIHALAGVTRWRNDATDSAGVPWSFGPLPITLMVQSPIDSLNPRRLFYHAPWGGTRGTSSVYRRWLRAACRPCRAARRRRDSSPASRVGRHLLRTPRGAVAILAAGR